MSRFILLDLDGVLADCVGAMAVVHDKDPSLVTKWGIEECWNISSEELWSPLDYNFWSNLPLTREAHQVVGYCSRAVGAENICILTSPSRNDGCMDGKRDWVKNNFPYFSKRLLIGSCKYFCASPQSLLIDDSEKNVDLFIEHGGQAFLFPRPWNKSRDEKEPIELLRAALHNFKDK